MSTLQQNQAAFFNFAHRARCAAAILRRADADIVRLAGVSLGVDFTFAHRALCERAMRRRAASETVRLPFVRLVFPAVFGRVSIAVRALIAESRRSRSAWSSLTIASKFAIGARLYHGQNKGRFRWL